MQRQQATKKTQNQKVHMHIQHHKLQQTVESRVSVQPENHPPSYITLLGLEHGVQFQHDDDSAAAERICIYAMPHIIFSFTANENENK